mmetsp:Transcript_110551/g.165486  ORF Transcript_110551/g.165486 Transcript_110551/m.165486 type:complete len:334 (-) Transcript_110551:26-1027(-)
MARSIAGVLFLAAGALAASNNFLMMGDWGGQETPPYYTPGEQYSAKVMAQWAEKYDSEFVLALGDNFYSHGITTDVTDARFNETFESVFNQDVFKDMPFYVLAGNHDHYGNVTAQVAYSEVSSRWNFPSQFYNFTHSFEGVDVDFVIVDTVVLAGLTHPELSDELPPGPEDVAAAEDAWSWIEDALKASVSPYLMVAGHYPTYSPCSHGPTPILVERLRPLMLKYNATAYIAGHDHCASALDDGSGLYYINSGNAHDCCYDATNVDKCPPNSIKFLHANEAATGGPARPIGRGGDVPDAGFAYATVTKDAIQVQWVNSAGEVQYTSRPILPRH